MQASIEQIVTTYRPMIYQICAGFTNDPGLANDLTQDTLFQVWKRLPDFRGEASLKTWIYRIAVNICLMDRRKPRPYLEEINDKSNLLAPPPHAPTEASLALRRAITSLPRRQRAVVLLHLEELSHLAIGQVLGLTENNVGVLLHRAKDHLRKILSSSLNSVSK